jgi:hypothetical protein
MKALDAVRRPPTLPLAARVAEEGQQLGARFLQTRDRAPTALGPLLDEGQVRAPGGGPVLGEDDGVVVLMERFELNLGADHGQSWVPRQRFRRSGGPWTSLRDPMAAHGGLWVGQSSAKVSTAKLGRLTTYQLARSGEGIENPGRRRRPPRLPWHSTGDLAPAWWAALSAWLVFRTRETMDFTGPAKRNREMLHEWRVRG